MRGFSPRHEKKVNCFLMGLVAFRVKDRWRREKKREWLGFCGFEIMPWSRALLHLSPAHCEKKKKAGEAQSQGALFMPQGFRRAKEISQYSMYQPLNAWMLQHRIWGFPPVMSGDSNILGSECLLWIIYYTLADDHHCTVSTCCNKRKLPCLPLLLSALLNIILPRRERERERL